MLKNINNQCSSSNFSYYIHSDISSGSSTISVRYSISSCQRCSLLLTVTINEVGQVQVQFSDGYVYMVRVNTEARMRALGRLFQAFPVGAFQWNSFEQDHHDQIQPPHLQQTKQPHQNLIRVTDKTSIRSSKMCRTFLSSRNNIRNLYQLITLHRVGYSTVVGDLFYMYILNIDSKNTRTVFHEFSFQIKTNLFNATYVKVLSFILKYLPLRHL